MATVFETANSTNTITITIRARVCIDAAYIAGCSASQAEKAKVEIQSKYNSKVYKVK